MHTYMYSRSQEGGKLKYIEQKELYASNSKHKAISSKLTNTSLSSRCRAGLSGTKPIIDSLKSTKMSESVIEPVLQTRSMTMKKHSELIKLLVDDNSTNAAQAKMPGCSNATNATTTSSALTSTLSLTTEPSTDVTCDSSTSQNDSVSLDTYNYRSPISLQAQAVSPLSYSSESQSPSTPQVSPSPTTSGSTVNSDGKFQIGWLASQNHFMQDLRVEPLNFDPPACYPVGQNGVQGLLDSDPTSKSPDNLVRATSPVYSPFLSNSTLQQGGAQSPGQFLDQASPISNYGSVISGTSSSNDMAVSDVSSPPSVFSPEMGTGLHATIGDDSIPLSAFSIPFQNSQTSNFVPQASTVNDFNPQIPSSFDFSFTHSYSSNLGTSSNLNNSALESQHILDTCSSLFLNPGDFITHESLGVIPNGDTSNIGDAVVPVSESDSENIMNIDSTLSNPHAHASNIQDAKSARSRSSHDLLSIESQTSSSNNMCSSNSNSEIQDILQQFF